MDVEDSCIIIAATEGHFDALMELVGDCEKFDGNENMMELARASLRLAYRVALRLGNHSFCRRLLTETRPGRAMAAADPLPLCEHVAFGAPRRCTKHH